jgi:hypothetical protein
VIAATPGWRVAIVERDNDCTVILHVVAWDRDPNDSALETLVPYMLEPGYWGGPVRRLRETDLFVAYLQPGEEIDEALYESAQEVLKAHREAQDRAHVAGVAS